jgi:hypothetical protein
MGVMAPQIMQHQMQNAQVLNSTPNDNNYRGHSIAS